MAATVNHTSVEKLNHANEGKLPGHLGLVITEVADGKVVGRLPVRQDLVAHTGFLLDSTAPMAFRRPGPKARTASPRRK